MESRIGTHQDPIPDCAPIDTIALGPDGDRHRPRNENYECLHEMDDILRPPQVATSGSWQS